MSYHRGFSLIEVLTILMIIGILSGCALFYHQPLLNTKTEIACEEVLHHLHYARSEAIKRNTLVGICGIEDEKTCSSNWEGGYLIFSQDIQNPSHKEILKIHAHPYRHTTLLGQFNHRNNILQFTPEGRAQKNGTIILRSKNTDFTQTIVISLSGRARLLNA